MHPNTWSEREDEVLIQEAVNGSKEIQKALEAEGSFRSKKSIQQRAYRLQVSINPPPAPYAFGAEEELWRPCSGKWAGLELSSKGRLRLLTANKKFLSGYALLPNMGDAQHGARYQIPKASSRVVDMMAEYWPEIRLNIDNAWDSWVRAQNKADNAQLNKRGFKQAIDLPKEAKIEDPDWYNLLGFKNLRVPDPAWGF